MRAVILGILIGVLLAELALGITLASALVVYM